MEQKEAKEQIAQLIDKYEQIREAGRVKLYTEEETKKEFILPLFKALGWDVNSKEEVSAEEHIKSSGMADYGFYINGRAKFYLEAKSLKADLHREDYAQQAIRYSFNKVVTWAVLTDFESVKVFNANAVSKYLGDKLYFEIPYNEYLDRFDQLWQLSRDSFEHDLIDKKATEAGKLIQKISVTDKLYQDMNRCRDLLTKSLSTWNSDVSEDLLDEGVQKLLDRIMFIRVAEDRNVEPPTLKKLIREWRNRKDNAKTIYEMMVDKFRELDKVYDSNLFGEHPFEGWEEYDDKTEEVIEILYGKEGYYEYDFKYIPADVLGNIYENYLGYRLAKSSKSISTTEAKKRKEQGIYYTPAFIVDYIVVHALKPVLDKCESIAELKQVKVLDPACGSGSFLLKAVELINDKYKEFGYKGDELTKVIILTDNIYGVDLDEQAVEIAQLNLLINSLDKRMKLPNLAKNIKNGNSLIFGTDGELEEAFGKSYRDKRPFNWQEEFPEVFNRENPGFDVIIGNPPYVGEKGSKEIFRDIKSASLGEFYLGKMDLFYFFFHLALNLSRKDGCIGFITTNYYLTAAGARKLRSDFKQRASLVELIDFGELRIFADAQGQHNLITLLKKESKDETCHTVVVGRTGHATIGDVASILMGNDQQTLYSMAKQKDLYDGPEDYIRLGGSSDGSSLMQKILNYVKDQGVSLGQVANVNQGVVSGADKVSDRHLARYTLRAHKGDGIFVLTDQEITNLKLNAQERAMLKPWFKNSDIKRWRTEAETDESIIFADKRKANLKPGQITDHLAKFKEILDVSTANSPYLHRPRSIDFEGEKIVSPQRSAQNTFAYNNVPWYASADVYFITPKDSSISLKYILALLNSKLYYHWLYHRGKRKGKMLELYQIPLSEVPIKKADREVQKQFEILVNKILKLNAERAVAARASNKWHAIERETERIEHRIDELVYELYALDAEEIKEIESAEKF